MSNLTFNRFYLFACVFSLIAVYWSFDYVSAQNRQVFGYIMWFLFVFYFVAFISVGFLGVHELYETFGHKRQMRRLERDRLAADISKTNADAYLIRSKGDATGLPKHERELAEGHNSRVLVDLSDAIRIPKVYPLIETIQSYQRILVVGGQGSGKTQVMLWLAKVRRDLSEAVLAIDTHASPEKWPDGVYVLGYGLDYEKAHKGFNKLIAQMNKRYRDIGDGIATERSHPVITVLTDEWTMLPNMIPKFTEDYVKPLFTLSRKTAIDLSLAAHDDTVGALGMTGYSKLRKSFDVVVYCEKTEDTYTALAQFGMATKLPPKKLVCLPPGPYRANGTPAQPEQNHVEFAKVPGVLTEDLRTLECMRSHYDTKLQGVWKQKVRRDLDIPATAAGYELIDKVGTRYNIKLV